MLKVKGSRKSWTSVRQALRCVWNAREIQTYEKQMESYRSEVSIRLLVILKEQHDHIIAAQLGIATKVSGVAGTLDRLAESHKRLEMCAQNQTAELRRSINNSLRDVLEDHERDIKTTKVNPVTFHFPAGLPANLLNLASESVLLQRQIHFIESLQFSGIAEREENIRVAHPGTFEWLFKDKGPSKPHSNILKWLRTGKGSFWISGKAGSGKSTLMKFFRNHNKTHTALRQWAKKRQLLVGSFFFWNSGTSMQKSQQGLLQTLLCHIFKQAPELIPIVCPSRWEQTFPFSNSHDTWKREEILQIFGRLKEQQIDSVCFCFFIDGLDEYDGDHEDVIRILDVFTSHDAVKICFSSRPWVVFERAFGENEGLKVRLQDLTRDDIGHFAEESLNEGRRSLAFEKTNQAYQSLVNEIVDRSDGVFLWVFLVVRSLRRGTTNLDTPAELQERLRQLPTELEAFFQQIFDKTEKFYRQQAARLYQICLAASSQLTTLDVACFAEQDPNFGVRDDLLATLSEQYHNVNFHQETITRVMARCQDLLEFPNQRHLQFLHRTVKDFLDTRDMSAQLEARAGESFNPHNFLCNSILIQLRLKNSASDMENSPYEFLNPILVQEMFNSFILYARRMRDQCRLHPQVLANMARSVWTFFLHSYDTRTIMTRDDVQNYLAKGIQDTVVMCDPIQHVIRMTPFDIALRHVNYEDRLLEVRRELEKGLDPNETRYYKSTNESPWMRYLHLLSWREWKSIEHAKKGGEIIKMLLLHGAHAGFLYARLKEKFERAEDNTAIEECYQGLLPEHMKQQRQRYLSQQHRPLPTRKRSLELDSDSQSEEERVIVKETNVRPRLAPSIMGRKSTRLAPSIMGSKGTPRRVKRSN